MIGFRLWRRAWLSIESRDDYHGHGVDGSVQRGFEAVSLDPGWEADEARVGVCRANCRNI